MSPATVYKMYNDSSSRYLFSDKKKKIDGMMPV